MSDPRPTYSRVSLIVTLITIIALVALDYLASAS